MPVVVDLETEEGAPAPALERFARIAKAESIVHRNVLWALGAGILPFPIVDLAAIVAVQAKLLKELSDLYGLPYREALVKKLVLSLLAGFGGLGIGTFVGASLAKLVPVLGTAVGVIAIPVAAGACTHATGRVFVMHFESGGTFLDFDPAKMREHFRAEFEAGKSKVADVQEQSRKSPM